MNATRVLLGALSLVLLSIVPSPAEAQPCAVGCGEVRVHPCVGAEAEAYATRLTTWTLSYYHPGGVETVTLTSYTAPPAVGGGQCWIPGCYSAVLTNDLGFHDDDALCIE